MDVPAPMIEYERRILSDGSIVEAPGCIDGAIMTRIFPDGTVTGIIGRMFGACDIFRSLNATNRMIEEQWTFTSYALAVIQLLSWSPLDRPDPDEWIRHRPSGRRRENGDPATETIRD